MKQIILKTVVLIDGVEHVLSSCDYSESIADHEESCEEKLDDEGILEYIQEEI